VQARFYCGLFHLLDLDIDLDCRYSVYLTGHTDFDCGLFRFPDIDTPILSIEFYVLNGAHGGCDRSTRDAYSLTPDPTSGFSRGPCLLNFLDLYYIRDLWDWSLFIILITFSFWWKDDSLVSKTAIYIKLNIILNLEFWNFNQEVHAGQTSEYWIEIAKDSKGYKMQVEKEPFLIFWGKF
jgi:hypothetical protein